MNYGVDWEAEQRQTLLDGRAALERTAQSFSRSQTVAAETEQIGREVINELGGQRETLLRAKGRLSETDQELDSSKKIMRLIARGVMTNKIVLILIIILEIAILLLTIYIKYFHKK
ncbi:hypothetical protein HCN44_009647 [Aphidius gifuensis]|uniref:Uncharacterized protein n=1 Tax=Aphidius gifuensis TaxID=684658 RepID=A0A835CVM7_APHGI|nr:hypothetical protein HCN44_009647 [Aphidius gifuensis]